MTQVPASNVLPLDKHNQPSLAVNWLSKPIETRSHPGSAGLNPRVFVGRTAPRQGAAVAVDPRLELRYAAEFYQNGEEGRSLEVLKCTPLVRRLAQKQCEVEVLQAMNSDGELDGCTYVRCTPWVEKPLKVETQDFEWKTMAMPTALQEPFAAIFSQLGVTQPLPAPQSDGSPESLWQKVRYDWAARLHFEVEAGSAHEIALRIGEIVEEIAALEAELATTSTSEADQRS